MAGRSLVTEESVCPSPLATLENVAAGQERAQPKGILRPSRAGRVRIVGGPVRDEVDEFLTPPSANLSPCVWWDRRDRGFLGEFDPKETLRILQLVRVMVAAGRGFTRLDGSVRVPSAIEHGGVACLSTSTRAHLAFVLDPTHHKAIISPLASLQC